MTPSPCCTFSYFATEFRANLPRVAGTSWWPRTIDWYRLRRRHRAAELGVERSTEDRNFPAQGCGCMHMLSSLPRDSDDAVEGCAAGRRRSGEATSLTFSFCHMPLTHLKASLRSPVAQGLESSTGCRLWLIDL